MKIFIYFVVINLIIKVGYENWWFGYDVMESILNWSKFFFLKWL